MVRVSEQSQITFHQLQDIYNTLTGKFESMTNALDRPYIVTFEDLKQLNYKISQSCDSYGARIKNETVSVYHLSGYKEVFSSFERFAFYNKGQISPVENISIEYSIIIIPAGSDKVVQYRIRVNLTSRAGLREKAPNIFSAPMGILKMLGHPIGSVSIQYIDYAAARHFMTQIMDWYEALEFNKESKVLTWLQSVSHIFRVMIPVSLVCAFVWAGGDYFSKTIMQGDVSQHFLSISQLFVFALIVWFLGGILGRLWEGCVDKIQPISCINLNKGDERVLLKWRSSNIYNILGAVTSALLALAINVMSSTIFELGGSILKTP